MIRLTIYGPPQGKARARTVKNRYTGKTMSFTPDKTVFYEQLVRSEFVIGGNKKMDGELTMKVKAFFSIPKSISHKKAALMDCGVIRPTKKPDADNILKIVADALNKVAYDDDSQIVSATVEKYYSNEPRVEVEIKVRE